MAAAVVAVGGGGIFSVVGLKPLIYSPSLSADYVSVKGVCDEFLNDLPESM